MQNNQYAKMADSPKVTNTPKMTDTLKMTDAPILAIIIFFKTLFWAKVHILVPNLVFQNDCPFVAILYSYPIIPKVRISISRGYKYLTFAPLTNLVE